MWSMWDIITVGIWWQNRFRNETLPMTYFACHKKLAKKQKVFGRAQ